MGEVNELGRDAAVLIMELNKGLSSSNLGEQCKAVAEFPILFEKYPFPMVINSIFLKISELFREGSNYMRLCILRACTECRGQLEKLTVSEDVVRKLLPVTASNDPAARALTLRIFGVLCCILQNNVSVHHIVISKLESHYEVELNAAIWTSYELASISRAFALRLCPIVCKLLEQLSTETDTKFKLIPLLQYAYHDTAFVPKIRSCLIDLVESYNIPNFVLKIFDTLTHLEINTPMHTTEQIDYLLQWLADDSRHEIKMNLLLNLRRLASRLPNHWNKSHILNLCTIFDSAMSTFAIKEGIFQIFYKLTNACNPTDLLLMTSDNPESTEKHCLESCIIWITLKNVGNSLNNPASSELVLICLALLCKLTVIINRRMDKKIDLWKKRDIFNPDSAAALVALIMSSEITLTSEDGKSSAPSSLLLSDHGPAINKLKVLYSEILQFFRVFPRFVSSIRSLDLIRQISFHDNQRTALLCQFLGHLCDFHECDWLPCMSQLFSWSKRMESAVHLSNKRSPNVSNLLAPCVLAFRMASGRSLDMDILNKMLASLARATMTIEVQKFKDEEKNLEPWLVYHLACQASLHCQLGVAAVLFERLSILAITDTTMYWLQGLATFSQAANDLINNVATLFAPRLNEYSDSTRSRLPRLARALQASSNSFSEARRQITSSGNRSAHWFQISYIDVCAALLSCLSELSFFLVHASALNASGRCARWARLDAERFTLDTASSFSASSALVSTRNALAMLQSFLPSWLCLSGKLVDLFRRCVDADLSTLRHLKMFHELVQFFIGVMTEFTGSESGSSIEESSGYLKSLHGAGNDGLIADFIGFDESGSSHDRLGRLLLRLKKVLASHRCSGTGTECGSHTRLLTDFVFLFAASPIYLPSFFFRRHQSTSIRLIILPNSTSSTEPLVLSQETGLVLKIMGIVTQQASIRTGLLRRVTATELVLSVSRLQSNPVGCMNGTGRRLLSIQRRVVPILRDYFHSEFCVSFLQFNESSDESSVPISSSGGRSLSASELYNVTLETFLVDSEGLRWRLGSISDHSAQSMLVRLEPRVCASTEDFSQPITVHSVHTDFSSPA